MTPYDQIISWAQNRWPIAAIIAIASLIIYLSGLLKHIQELHSKLFSGEKLFKKSGLEFVQIKAYHGNACWKSSESKMELETKSKAKAAGKYEGLHYKDDDYLADSTLLFELQGRFDNDPNPMLDILISNNSASPKLLLSYGLEVTAARYRQVSGGSVEKITLDESDHYKIEFPLPRYINGVTGDEDTPRTMEVPADRYSGHGAIYLGDLDSTDLVSISEWKWAHTPVVSTKGFADPPLLKPGQPYRFTLEIDKSERMPTDTLLRVAINTNDGDFKSETIYFLKV